jgi:hypothetical protein
MRFKPFLTLILFSAGLVCAQTSPVSYRVAVIDGEGAMNNVATGTSREPVIQVTDADHHPVAGAYVEFTAPASGAGAHFANGGTHFATTTNSDGLAVGSNLQNNGLAGAYVLAVHVSFRGQSIGDAQVHQTNISANAARHLQQQGASGAGGAEVGGNVTISNNVLGIALGDQFLLNGAPTPSNANLLTGARIQSLDKPTSLYLHDRCEYILAPHASVTVEMKMVTLESGSVRAKRFGDCRIMYGGLFITGDPTADGVASLTGQNLDVGSVSGTVKVVNGAGDVISSVNPGTVSSFGTSTASSGATIGGPTSLPFKTALLLGSSVGVALAGMGLATDAILQPTSSGTPTSP